MKQLTEQLNVELTETQPFFFNPLIKKDQFVMKDTKIGVYHEEPEGTLKEVLMPKSGLLKFVNRSLEARKNESASLTKRSYLDFQNEGARAADLNQKKDDIGQLADTTQTRHEPRKKEDRPFDLGEFEDFLKKRNEANGSGPDPSKFDLDLILGIKKEKRILKTKFKLVEIELCQHPLIYKKVCTICFEHVPDMKPQILGLQSSEVELRGKESSKILINSLKSQKKLVMILDLDHTIVHSCCVVFESRQLSK